MPDSKQVLAAAHKPVPVLDSTSAQALHKPEPVLDNKLVPEPDNTLEPEQHKQVQEQHILEPVLGNISEPEHRMTPDDVEHSLKLALGRQPEPTWACTRNVPLGEHATLQKVHSPAVGHSSC